MTAIQGTLLLTARTFTAHCGRCGKAWSIPADLPDFDEQQQQIIDWYHAHECPDPPASVYPENEEPAP